MIMKNITLKKSVFQQQLELYDMKLQKYFFFTKEKIKLVLKGTDQFVLIDREICCTDEIRYRFTLYSCLPNRRRGMLIKFLANFQPLSSYSVPYVY